MNVPPLKRSDLKKLITISLLIKKLSGAFSQLSDDTKSHLSSEPFKLGENIDNLEKHIGDSIDELKKPEIEHYNYQKYRKSAEYQNMKLDKNKPKKKLR